MIRTTLVLEDGCMAAVREIAAREDRTLSDVVNSLLADALQRRRAARRPPRLDLPSYSMGVPRVNLGDRNALEALMDS